LDELPLYDVPAVAEEENAEDLVQEKQDNNKLRKIIEAVHAAEANRLERPRVVRDYLARLETSRTILGELISDEGVPVEIGSVIPARYEPNSGTTFTTTNACDAEIKLKIIL
jgi:hypothetical protein